MTLKNKIHTNMLRDKGTKNLSELKNFFTTGEKCQFHPQVSICRLWCSDSLYINCDVKIQLTLVSQKRAWIADYWRNIQRYTERHSDAYLRWTYIAYYQRISSWFSRDSWDTFWRTNNKNNIWKISNLWNGLIWIPYLKRLRTTCET